MVSSGVPFFGVVLWQAWQSFMWGLKFLDVSRLTIYSRRRKCSVSVVPCGLWQVAHVIEPFTSLGSERGGRMFLSTLTGWFFSAMLWQKSQVFSMPNRNLTVFTVSMLVGSV